MLHLNAAAQNGYPYDDFHVLIGLFPALLHRAPAARRSPSGSASARRRTACCSIRACAASSPSRSARASATCSRSSASAARTRAGGCSTTRGSTCAPATAASGCSPPSSPTTSSPSTRCARRAATAATSTPSSSTSSSLRAWRRGGLFAQWVPTTRVLASVAEVFPHVATAVGPGPATFLVASNEPLPADLADALARFRARPHGALSPEQRASLERFFEHAAAHARAPRRAARRNAGGRAQPRPAPARRVLLERRLSRSIRSPVNCRPPVQRN